MNIDITLADWIQPCNHGITTSSIIVLTLNFLRIAFLRYGAEHKHVQLWLRYRCNPVGCGFIYTCKLKV